MLQVLGAMRLLLGLEVEAHPRVLQQIGPVAMVVLDS
jgi:hypothetical protein